MKKAILGGFHLILLSLGYASETLRIPISSLPKGQAIILGEVFETEPCDMLDEMHEAQHKASLGPSLPLGRILFARNIRPSSRYVAPGVRWNHPGARFKDIGDMRRWVSLRTISDTYISHAFIDLSSPDSKAPRDLILHVHVRFKSWIFMPEGLHGSRKPTQCVRRYHHTCRIRRPAFPWVSWQYYLH